MTTLAKGILWLIALPFIVLALLLLAFVSAELLYSSSSRFRLTVEFDTPSGVRSASNVYHYDERPRIGTGGGGVNKSIKGDAIFVDLGQGKHVVVIMGHGERAHWTDSFQSFWFFPYQRPAEGAPILRSPRPGDGPREITGGLIPTMVTFDDLTDPRTARVVYAWGHKIEMSNTGQQAHDRGPELKIDDIAKTFGDGYAFKRAWVEIAPAGIWPLSALGLPFNFLGLTGTPITRGIEKRLPFLVAHREELRRVQSDMPPRFQPRYGYFRIE
ncbi:MAG TPA: hypothetical protein PK970_14015 [Hyphomicrobiaceae bacterium]|nr:hypothetical protein [Hyphomicrobiaceae bacterium]